jgi:hypothetical protein
MNTQFSKNPNLEIGLDNIWQLCAIESSRVKKRLSLRILKLLEWEKQTISSCNNILSVWDLQKKAATENVCLGFLNFPCALMKASTGWWCQVWTIERSCAACTVWIFKLLKQCQILSSFRAMKLWWRLKKTNKLPMLAKDSTGKKKPQGRILLRNWAWRLREFVGLGRSSSLQTNHGKLFRCPRAVKVSLLERAVRCHRRPLGLGVSPSSTLRRRIWRIAIARWAAGSARVKVLNLMHIFMWLSSASSMPASGPSRLLSSFTASEHKPHTKWPQNIFLVRSMYADVHSSARPQHSHLVRISSSSSSPPSFSGCCTVTGTVKVNFDKFSTMSAMAAEVVVVVVSDAALHKFFISVWPHAPPPPPPPPLLLTNGLDVVIIVSTAVPIAFLLSSPLPSCLLCHSLTTNPLQDCEQTLLPMNNNRRRRRSSITYLFNLSKKKKLAKVSQSLRIDQQSLKLEEILLLALSEPLTFFLLQGSQTNLRIPHQKPWKKSSSNLIECT